MNRIKTLSTTDVHPSFTLAQLRELGMFATSGNVAMDVQGLRVEAFIRRDGGGAALRLQWRRPGGGLSGQSFGLEPRPLPFGGAAWWIGCACGARTVALFLDERTHTWGCRKCMRLAYPSQRLRYPRAWSA